MLLLVGIFNLRRHNNDRRIAHPPIIVLIASNQITHKSHRERIVLDNVNFGMRLNGVNLYIPDIFGVKTKC